MLRPGAWAAGLRALLAAALVAGCAAAPRALYGRAGAAGSSVIALDPGVCIVAAAHERDRTQALQCGRVEVAAPAGEHIIVATYRPEPGYQAARLFALAFGTRASTRYRISAIDMVYEFVRVQGGDGDCDSLVEEDGQMLAVPQSLVVRTEDGRPVAHSRDDLLDHALSLHEFQSKCERRPSSP